MVWKRIKSIEWVEMAKANPEGEFRLIIQFDSKGMKGHLCRLWLRKWCPIIVQILRRLLKMDTSKVTRITSQITSGMKKEFNIDAEKVDKEGKP